MDIFWPAEQHYYLVIPVTSLSGNPSNIIIWSSKSHHYLVLLKMQQENPSSNNYERKENTLN
jgi:hypothetical protein